MKHYLTIFLFLLAGLISYAQPQDLRSRALSAEKYSYSGQVVLLDSTAVTVAPTGSGAFVIYKAILVNSKSGALANRIVRYDYDPLTAFAEFEYVKVHKADGKVVSLDVSKTCDYAAPARSIYWGARQIMMEVGRMEPGDILEYKINKKGFTYALLADNADEDRFIPPMRGHFYDIVPFWSSYPTLKKVYRLSMPMEKEIQYQFYQGECTTSMRYEEGRRVYTFAKKDIVPFRREANMVDLYDAAPKLMMSTTDKWQDKSLWFYKTNEDYGSFEAFAPARKKVKKLIRGLKDEMEIISVLTHWVADNIRYAGITMGEGEGFTLHNTEMNYTDRCGVCKDIAGTLVSFLRMAGLEAYPAMTMAGSRVESIPADHFNHCVAVVKLSNGTYMPLDPTWVPFCREVWSSAEQQQNYLPGVPEGSDLCISPVSAPENHYFRIKADTRLDANGKLTGEFVVSAEGQSDLRVRGVFTTGWQTEWMNSMEKQILAVSPKAKLLSVDWGEDPKDYQAAPIRIVFRFEIPDYAVVSQDALFVKPLTMNRLYSGIRSYERINTRAEHKQYGFKDACSRLVELDETMELPQGYTLVNGKRTDEKSAAADFNGYIRQNGNKVEMHQQLVLRKRVYEPEDWEGFRTAVNRHKTYGEYLIINK